MALQLQTYTNSQGYEIKEGYFILTEVKYNLVDKLFSISGCIFLSKEHFENGFMPVDNWSDRIGINEPPKDFVRFAYDHIIETANTDKETLRQENPKYFGFYNCKEVE